MLKNYNSEVGEEILVMHWKKRLGTHGLIDFLDLKLQRNIENLTVNTFQFCQ